MTEAQREWARCRPWIEAAIKPGGLYTIEYIEAEITKGEMHFWPGKHCAAVTEFLTYPLRKVLNVFVGSGDRGKALRELLHLEADIIEWGKSAGCSRVMFFGVNETTQLAGERAGYTHLWTVMGKDI